MTGASRSWIQFFDQQAETYDQNGFTQFTEKEVDFILATYPISANARILDVGCGTGRHAIEFAKRGFRVTGVDLSEKMIEVARRKAAALELEVEFVHADARFFALDAKFDVAICLCEGALGLIEKGENAEEHDLQIFQRIAEHLVPAAPFVMTCLNGYSSIRQMKDELVNQGRFDPATMVSNYTDEFETASGRQLFQINERLFIAPEIKRMLESSGYQVDRICGGTAGHWGPRPLSLDEVEVMFLSRLRP